MCLKECIKEHVALISLIRIPYPMLMIKLFNFDKRHGITTTRIHSDIVIHYEQLLEFKHYINIQKEIKFA